MVDAREGGPDEPGRGRRPGRSDRRDRSQGSSRGDSRAGSRSGAKAGPGPARRSRAAGVERGRGPTRPAGGSRRGEPGRGESRAATAEPELAIDEDVTGDELDPDVAAELGSLSRGAARAVAKHLVMAARLLDDDPELAYRHTLEARRRAARIGVVREAAGVAAYTAGRYAEALSELRAARRITGSAEYLPMMADCERGLGRPRRALDLAADPAVTGLPQEDRIEMLIVAAGARRDLGDIEAAVVSLQIPELRSKAKAQWVARLRYAYADLLEAAGRREEARRWFIRAAEADIEDETDAADRAVRLADQPG